MSKQLNPADFRWDCSTCGKEHRGLPLDWSVDKPYYFENMPEDEVRIARLGTDLANVGEKHFFIRGVIEIPIIGFADALNYGVWTSLSQKNYAWVYDHWDDRNLHQHPPMFSWLDTQIANYPPTVSLKTNLHLRNKLRPAVELEPTDHPLAVEQRNGITIERVLEIAHKNGVH